jgi:hypothetical protein
VISVVLLSLLGLQGLANKERRYPTVVCLLR